MKVTHSLENCIAVQLRVKQLGFANSPQRGFNSINSNRFSPDWVRNLCGESLGKSLQSSACPRPGVPFSLVDTAFKTLTKARDY